MTTISLLAIHDQMVMTDSIKVACQVTGNVIALENGYFAQSYATRQWRFECSSAMDHENHEPSSDVSVGVLLGSGKEFRLFLKKLKGRIHSDELQNFMTFLDSVRDIDGQPIKTAFFEVIEDVKDVSAIEFPDSIAAYSAT